MGLLGQCVQLRKYISGSLIPILYKLFSDKSTLFSDKYTRTILALRAPIQSLPPPMSTLQFLPTRHFRLFTLQIFGPVRSGGEGLSMKLNINRNPYTHAMLALLISQRLTIS
jgi:hypothetical protein